MRQADDVFAREGAPSLIAETIAAVLRDPVSSVDVEYVSIGSRTSLAAARGALSHAATRIKTRAWRNVQTERESPGPDVGTQTYVVDAAPLLVADASPRKGDFIVDAPNEMEITHVEVGEIGPSVSYFLFETVFRGKQKKVG